MDSNSVFLTVHWYAGLFEECHSFDIDLARNLCDIGIFAKDCLLTLVKSRLALALFWSFVFLGVTMPKMAHYTGKWLLTAP